MSNVEKTDLKEIIKQIQRQELLLPDFQRGFVWDVSMQQRLVASVLTKMPIGSILILEADRDDYGCRILGRKDDVDFSGNNREVQVLLDGQQRITALANIFSNQLFYDYIGSGNLMTDYKKLISVDLQNRFFLRIPSVENLNEENDLFHLKDLQFAIENPEGDIPQFLTDDIRNYIVYYSYDQKTQEAYAPHTQKPQNIGSFCIKEDCYEIPLYLLISDSRANKANETRLKNILKDIVKNVVRYRLENEYDILPTDIEKKAYIDRQIDEDYKCDIYDGITGEIDRDRLEMNWNYMGETYWGDKMKQYLVSCVTQLDLKQINVPKANRNRAIDIYENLNIGGISLSTFELILAKAAKKKLPDKKNLFDLIVEEIQRAKTYEDNVVPEQMEKYYKEFTADQESYSAAEQIGCFDDKKNQLNKTYTDTFLNVLSLISYIPDYDAKKMELSYLKREKILALSADKICQNYKKTCEGIDRACFFLQVRCGIRKIQEINYNLMFVLLGYIFSNNSFYEDKDIMKLLETWYWCSVFSGRYDKDQNGHIIEDIKNVLETIGSPTKTDWLADMKEKVFAMQGFSDKKTLLMQTSVVPKGVIRKKICQFYMAKTYKDLMTEEYIQVFSKQADKFEEHHIVPIGSLDKDTFKGMEKRRREDKKNIFNSPLNFMYITKESNLIISNQSLAYYVQFCNDATIYDLHIDIANRDSMDDDYVEQMLEKRFQTVKKDVVNRIEKYL